MGQTRANRHYVAGLLARMKQVGVDNWSKQDMADMCELAGIWLLWVNAKTKSAEKKVAMTAFEKLTGYY